MLGRSEALVGKTLVVLLLASMVSTAVSAEISIVIDGASYDLGDDYNGRTWLQLLEDDRSQPEENATCYVQTYNPDDTIYEPYTVMDYVDEGIYAWNFVIPNETGIYPQSVKCDVPQSIDLNVTDDWECDGYDCGSGWNGDWRDIEDACFVDSGDNPRGSYHLEADAGAESGPQCDIYREFDSDVGGPVYVTFWAKADSLEGNDDCRYYYYDGSSYNEILTISNPGDDDTYRFYSFEVANQYGASPNAQLRVFADVSSTADDCYIDDIEIYTNTSVNVTQYVGASQVHVQSWITDILAKCQEALQTLQAFVLEVLGIVDQLNIAVDVPRQTMFVGEQSVAQAFVTRGNSSFDGANCSMTVFNPDMSKFLDDVQMEGQGELGVYTYNVTPESLGTHTVSVECGLNVTNNSTNTTGMTAIGRGSWDVFQGANMRVIT